MTSRQCAGAIAKWGAAALALGAASYAGYVSMAWFRYGHATAATGRQADALLDRYMPAFDVAERHLIYVEAPAAVTLKAASDLDLQRSVVVRAIFRARALLLGSRAEGTRRPRGLLALTRAVGWGVLAETPGREVVMGAVTQPWDANVVFRALPADEFAGFNEPGYVKIAWTLRADPLTDRESIFRTETRAIATDAMARARFRRYWSWLSPGIILIRRAMLGPLRSQAELQARRATTTSADSLVREAGAP